MQGEEVPATGGEFSRYDHCLHKIADCGIPADEPKKKREYKEMEHKTEGDLHAKVDMNTVSEISYTCQVFSTTPQ